MKTTIVMRRWRSKKLVGHSFRVIFIRVLLYFFVANIFHTEASADVSALSTGIVAGTTVICEVSKSPDLCA